MPIDYKKYPKNWLKEIRPRILKRAEDCCEFCGVENGISTRRSKGNPARYLSAPEFFGWGHEKRWGKAIKIVLTIAHLDHDIKNNDDLNLAALCQRCHLKHDKIDNLEKKRRKKQEKVLKQIREFGEAIEKLKEQDKEKLKALRPGTAK